MCVDTIMGVIYPIVKMISFCSYKNAYTIQMGRHFIWSRVLKNLWNVHEHISISFTSRLLLREEPK